MPSFIDIATLTKRATITGQEEFQVSATEKVTSEQLAKFAQMLTGFSTINTTDGVINGESNLLEALQVLYKLSSGNGKIRMLNGGSTFGFAYCDALMSGFIVEVEIGQVYWIMDDNSFNGDYSTATDYGIINVIRNNGNSAQLGCIPITDWKNIHNNFYAIATRINKKTNIVPVISTSNLSSGPQTTAPYIGFALIISNTPPYKAAYFVADGKGDFYYAFVTQTSVSAPANDITWNKIGSSGGGATTDLTGEIVAEGLEYLVPDGTSYDEIESGSAKIVPFVVNQYSSQTPDEGANVGFGLMGKISYYYSIAMMAVMSRDTDSDEAFYVGRIDNQGGGTDWYKLLMNNFSVPIPGYSKVNSDNINCSLVHGSTTVASLTKSVRNNAFCFIEANVLTSATVGTVKTSVTLMFFRYASGSIMCDINSKEIGGTRQGQVQLAVGPITGDRTGFAIMTTAYDLDSSLSNGIIRITSIYAQI